MTTSSKKFLKGLVLLMKNTRKLFVLSGEPQMVCAVLKHLDFKGATRFEGTPTAEQIRMVFNNNKSVICSNIPNEFRPNAINIIVGNSNSINIDTAGCYFIDIDGDIISQFEEIANKNNADIGDHRKNSSGLNGAPSIKDCAYCGYISNNFYDNKHHINRAIYKSENFFVMPTLGEFITGYLLIIPNEHIMSNAELSATLQKEFFFVLDDILYILELTYHTPYFLIWENGTGNSGKGKAKDSVVHSHVHVAPSKLTASKIEKLSHFNFTRISKDELSLYGNHSYLLIRDTENCWFINSNPELYIPRQYVRQLLAEEHGIEGEAWNWRTHPFSELILQTLEDIESALKSHWDELPERIQKNTRFLF